MAKTPKVREIESEFTQAEAEQRRDTILKRMLQSKPKPHQDMVKGKPKGGSAKSKKA